VPTYVFEEVKVYGEKNLPCPGCGKKAKRRTTLMQTLNPFNISEATGHPKTRREIYEELGVRLAAWKEEPELHARCAEEAPS
jgi:hypothetical protein